MKRLLILSVLTPAAVFWSCNMGQGPSEPAAGAIEYTVSGGFAGGVQTHLTVDPGGRVTLLSVYPSLEDNLTAEEQGSLMNLFAEIRKQPDDINGGCVDDFTHEIRWTDGRGDKIVHVDGCALNPTNGTHPYPTLEGIVRILNNLALRVQEQKSPWRGITAAFAVDKTSYDLDEPIRFSYVVKNPTALDRGLFFRHADQFWFSISKNNDPGFYYSFPTGAFSQGNSAETSSPSTLYLRPGEERELVYLWDHSFSQPGGGSGRLGPGEYHVRMGLLAGDLAPKDVSLDVYDRRLPVKGDILPDWTGSDGSSARYVFQLQVTNWTQSIVTLHFPNSQRIAIELWDLNFNPPTTVIYRTPLSTVNEEQSRAIAPLETVVFSEVVNKSDIAPSYFWTLAKIKLLCTDFEFTRDGQLQIFR